VNPWPLRPLSPRILVALASAHRAHEARTQDREKAIASIEAAMAANNDRVI
jgi:hypothetical protein